MNDELERMWKEAVVAYYKVFFWRVSRKPKNTKQEC
jgi:DNA/RNA-binding domain of Phe-tRNA-synthetase-like protein